MKRAAIQTVLSGLLLAPLAGCGTVLNTFYFTPKEGDRKIYGGAALDAEEGPKWIREAFVSDESLGRPPLKPRPALLFAGAYLLAIDLPLSLVADTLILPITVPAAYWNALERLDLPPEEAEIDPVWRRIWAPGTQATSGSSSAAPSAE